MTRKKVSTTYKREYSPERSAQRPSVMRSFDANYNYREYRRAVEHGHQRSPFVWDDWEYELESDDSEPTQQTRVIDKSKQKSKPKDKTIISPRSVTQSSSSESNHSSAGSGRPTTRDKLDQQCQTSVRSPRQRQPRSQPKQIANKTRVINKSPPYSDDDCNCGADNRPPYRYQGQPVRVLSDTISKSLKKVSKKCEQSGFDPSQPRPSSAPVDDSPFVQYGRGDDEKETGAKRTHNVQSQEGVYPSALNAQQRNQASKEFRKTQLIKQTRPKTTMFDPRFDNRMNKQTKKWQSEYSKNFRQFPEVDYDRNARHRPPY